MRKTLGTVRCIMALSILFPLVSASPFAGEAPVRRNPALPNPDDLITFDASGPNQPADPVGVTEPNQRAFPTYYGALPVTTGVTVVLPPLEPEDAPLRAPPLEVLPLQSTTPLGPAAPYSAMEATSGLATVTSSSEGFVDYQDYLRKQQGGDGSPAMPLPPPHLPERPAAVVAVVPERTPEPVPQPPERPAAVVAVVPERMPESASPPAEPSRPPVVEPAPSELAVGDMPVPLPPPAEVVEMAAAENRAANARLTGADSTPAARPIPEPPPVLGGLNDRPGPAAISPPPLPELAGAARSPSGDGAPEARAPRSPDAAPTSAPAPRAAPTLDQMQAEFNTLKAYCEADSLGSAAEIYAQMPDFGQDEEINRLRADAANLLILGLARTGNLMGARRVYDSVPADPAGFDARLAKARAVINLTTYYIRAERYSDAFTVLMDVGKIQNRSALNNELFRLMARMIPYLDNAEETDKAQAIYDLLLGEVKSPGTAALFAENVRASVLGYYLHYVDKSDSPIHRRKRLDFLEHIFNSLDKLEGNQDIRALQKYLGDALMERYAGDPDRAALFFVES